jgi:hypothetical protein
MVENFVFSDSAGIVYRPLTASAMRCRRLVRQHRLDGRLLVCNTRQAELAAKQVEILKETFAEQRDQLTPFPLRHSAWDEHF